MDTTLAEIETEIAEEAAEEAAAETPGEGNGERKKHSRPVIFIEQDGVQVPAEKVWGFAIFPAQMVREFTQYCRDTGQSVRGVAGKLIEDGMGAIFQEVERTAAERAANRTAKALPSDEASLAKQEAKLTERIAAELAKLEAVKARVAALRSANPAAEVVGEDPLKAILGETEPTAEAPTPAPSHGRHGKKAG